jgi:hypothetical protein
MKTKYKNTRVTRTSGWQSQIDVDIELSDTDISSLTFYVESLYPQQLRYLRETNDLNDPDSQQKYKLIQQKLVMANEELAHRIRDIDASPTYQNRGDRFDDETGLVIDMNGDLKYGLSFNEDEDDIVYDHTNNTTSHPTLIKKNNKDDETNYVLYKRHTVKGIYEEDWNTSLSQFDEPYTYQDDMDEEE